MKLLYILFFVTLDLLIFSYLIKKIRLNRTVSILCIALLFIFVGIHFLNPSGGAIPNEIFKILIGFSMSLFVFRFGKNLSMWVSSMLNKEKDELLLKWFGFWVDYVIYVMVIIVQIGIIIDAP
ncbi:hypothetical protein ACYSNM_08200 [Myroides sp. LJL116]